MGVASSPCRAAGGTSSAPKPDRASLCAATQSLPPYKSQTIGLQVAACCALAFMLLQSARLNGVVHGPGAQQQRAQDDVRAASCCAAA